MTLILRPDLVLSTEVAEVAAQIQEYASQLAPTADFSKGTALYDLLIRPAAILQAISEVNIVRAMDASSLLKISENPDLADTEMVDSLLSNYRIARKGGVTSSGSVEIRVSSNVITAIPNGATFVSGGLTFFTTAAYVGVPNTGLVSSPYDRVMREVASGVYAFTIEVTAADVGTAYQLKQGDTIVMQLPPSNYITSKAAVDFTTGLNAETNAELINRMPAGLANRTPGNRTNVEALILESYPDVKATSIVGYGQPEMTRDQDNPFFISYGGKSDIYVQTASRPQIVRVQKTAILSNSVTKAWQISFGRDEFAGVYKIVAVLPLNSTDVVGSLTVTSEARSVSVPTATDGVFVPHIDNVTQASFSRYQAMVVEFLDPYTSTSGLTPMVSTNDYYVDLLVMPQISDIQDNILSNSDLRAFRYDDIVRAPIPVLVALSLGLSLKNGDSPDSSAIKQTVADRINGLGFRSVLSASYITDAVHGLLGAKSSVIMPIDMIGELIDPDDGSSKIYRSSTSLSIPDDYTKQISTNTVMFFCDPSSIAIYTER